MQRGGNKEVSRPRSGLQIIPGVGPSIEKDLQDLGFSEVGALRDQDPMKMFDDLCELRGESIDRCVLYVFRSAVYFASNERHDAELLKWWNWKDRKL